MIIYFINLFIDVRYNRRKEKVNKKVNKIIIDFQLLI